MTVKIKFDFPDPRVCFSSPSWSRSLAQASTGVCETSADFLVAWSWKPSLCSFHSFTRFSFILFLFYEHISIFTWGQGTCQSMQLSAIQHTSKSDGQHCGLVSGRKRSVFTRGRRGWECQQLGFTAVREAESEGPLQPFSGSGSAAGRNFMDSLKLRRKCCP